MTVHRRRHLLVLGQTVVLAAIYFAAAELGLSLAVLNKSVSPVWPPTGVAIAALLLLGYRAAPAIFLGALLANYRLTDVSLVTALGIAVGNALEAVTALVLLRRFTESRRLFDRASDVVKFIIVAALISPMVGATIGNLSLCLGRAATWQSFGTLWLTWWLGDGVGALIITPLILTWVEKPRERLLLSRLAEGTVVVLLLVIVSLFVYTEFFMPRAVRYPIGHLTIPLLLLAAFRFGPRGAATAICAMAAIAVWGTTHGIGAFASANKNESLLLLQAYVANMTITALTLAAIVTERRLAQQKVRISEAQLQLVTDTTPVLLVQCTRDLRYKYVNRAYAEMLDSTPEQIMGKSLVDVVGSAAFETIRPYINKVLQGQPVEYEERVPFRGVDPRWLRGAYMPDRNKKGDVVGWVGSITDITKRKHTESALIESEGRLKLALAAGKMGAWEWNILTGQVIWSAGLEEIHGLAPGTFGGTVDDFQRDIYCEDRELVAAAIQRAIKTQEEYHVVYRFTRPDGAERWAEAFGKLVLSAKGQAEKLTGVCMDITDRKHAEEERQRLLVREHEARAEAEAANRTKDEFLATLSHELRTPLNAVVGWAGMLRSGKLDDDHTTRAIEIIDRNAKAQAQLIEDILDVSRIVSGKVRLDVRPVEAAQIIEAAVDAIRPAAESKSIQLQVTIDSSVGPISGDPGRLQQIVWNLLSNGVKFTPPGGEVEIRARADGHDVEIIVSDTGEGISPDFIPYVFERFRQADGSLTRKHKGLGLGLAIVRHLVGLHGGSVKAESEGEGKGTTFRVRLPLLTGWPESQLKPSGSPEPGETPERVLSGLRVLVVDDEADARELLSTMLRNFGAVVNETASATEALAALANWPPDILISDIEMPTVDGYQLIHHVRAREAECDGCLPAVALTAHARAEDRERALRAGFQVHISKPITPAELRTVLLRLTGRLNTEWRVNSPTQTGERTLA